MHSSPIGPTGAATEKPRMNPLSNMADRIGETRSGDKEKGGAKISSDKKAALGAA